MFFMRNFSACRLLFTFATIFLFTEGIFACRGGNTCNEAAKICNAPEEVDDKYCIGDVESYAECIVNAGKCDPTTMVECASENPLNDGSIHWPSDGGDGPFSSQSEICGRYLDCAAVVTPAALPGLIEGYGPNGTCWVAGSSAVCDVACRTGLSQLRVAADGEPACKCKSDDECLESNSKYCDPLVGQCGECNDHSHCEKENKYCLRTPTGPRCDSCEDGYTNGTFFDTEACGLSVVYTDDFWSAAPLCIVQGNTPTCIGCNVDEECGWGSCNKDTHRCSAAKPDCTGTWQCLRYSPINCEVGGNCCNQQRCNQSADYMRCMMTHCSNRSTFDESVECSQINCKPQYQACDNSCVQ